MLTFFLFINLNKGSEYLIHIYRSLAYLVPLSHLLVKEAAKSGQLTCNDF